MLLMRKCEFAKLETETWDGTMLALSRLTKRPRDVSAIQAASILYGDWGTSKAYVIGLAFALAGYSSFWLIGMLGILNILVGLNYINICRCYPGGGGVYASVYKRSQVLALVAAFFLIADYLVTAALSALSAFSYLGVPHPEHWAMASILAVGLLNYLGPHHTGNLAFLVSVPTVLVVIILGCFSLPFLGTAVHNLQPLQGGIELNWMHFVGVVVGMSGIEAIANTTGVMVLNPNPNPNPDQQQRPSVTRTSTPAILSVMIEVTLFTCLFALAAMALPHLTLSNGNVNAPDQPEIRDSMLRYMGEYFGTHLYGYHFGVFFGFIVSLVFCVLLLSAVNTAIVALVSLLFVMSRDGAVPYRFQKLNSFGVPVLPLIIATIIPISLVFLVHDVAGLADLYAVGFVGAIATNLGSTSSDRKLPLTWPERIFMFGTFLIMAAIEVTLFISKPDARNFALTIMACGLLLRALVIEQKLKKPKPKPAAAMPAAPPYSVLSEDHLSATPDGAILCAVSHIGKTLEYALEESAQTKRPLYLLFIRAQQVITEEDRERSWLEDKAACKVFDYAKDYLDKASIKFLYTVSDAPAFSIIDIAKKLGVSRIILGQPRGNKFFQFIRGNIIREVGRHLPKNVDLIVIS